MHPYLFFALIEYVLMIQQIYRLTYIFSLTECYKAQAYRSLYMMGGVGPMCGETLSETEFWRPT